MIKDRYSLVIEPKQIVGKSISHIFTYCEEFYIRFTDDSIFRITSYTGYDDEPCTEIGFNSGDDIHPYILRELDVITSDEERYILNQEAERRKEAERKRRYAKYQELQKEFASEDGK